MKVKKKKKVETIPKLEFEWKGNIRYCKAPNGHEFPYQKKSKKHPNESEYLQQVRLTHNVADDVDLEKILVRDEQKKTWMGRTIYELNGFWPGCVFTTTDKKRIHGRILKITDEKVVYQKYGEDDDRRYKLPPDTKVVWGDPFAPPEPKPSFLSFTVKPKADVGPTVVFTDQDVKSTGKVKRDRFGAKIGSEAAKINEVLDDKGKTVSTIRKESGTTRNITSHLAGLIKKGLVRKFVGKKTGRILYKVRK